MKAVVALTTALSVALTACSITVPVAVISENGDILRGTSTASLSGSHFEVAGDVNGRPVTCAGNYNGLDASVTISMPIHCSDGRSGIVIATRQQNGTDGSGRIRLEDGTEADFVFGQAAAAF